MPLWVSVIPGSTVRPANVALFVLALSMVESERTCTVLLPNDTDELGVAGRRMLLGRLPFTPPGGSQLASMPAPPAFSYQAIMMSCTPWLRVTGVPVVSEYPARRLRST